MTKKSLKIKSITEIKVFRKGAETRTIRKVTKVKNLSKDEQKLIALIEVEGSKE